VGSVTIVSTNREMMTGYVDALIARGDFAQYFTDDVTFEVAWNGPRAEGRQAVEATIRYLHEQVFDSNPELKQMTVEGDSAALELVFVGRHIGDFNGVSASGKLINVPYMAQYDLAAGHVRALRIYISLDEVMRQIQS
jgi:predicted ester cyclase